ncbi:MAG TPA: FHA domain-containing protein [Pyrinomonadaceae bacterium]|nr:FHA domain-containing protein [Pyrinomonadaceae bacterium]
MSAVNQTTFIIAREDNAQEPKTIVRQGLRIGRAPDSDIWLNHPTVSRLHAGVNEIGGYFYIVNLSASSATALNGRIIPFNEAAALTAGDEIQIGPYFLNIEETDATLRIRIVVQFALAVGEREPRHKAEAYKKQLATPGRIAPTSEISSSLKIWWDDKRTRERAGRLSPLHPQTPPRVGKIRFNWKPTRDLVRPWPFAIFIWAVIVIGTLSAVAAVKYKIAFAPEPISAPHTATTFTLIPAIAKQTNAGSCTSCHALGISVANKAKMSANCAACHQTEAFAPTIIRAHREAGLTCVTCHEEHRGKGFKPMNTALESCAKCHNDDNKNHYNGKAVHTPHGGTFGYPVVNGVWVWKGLDAEELEAKPEIAALLKNNRANPNDVQEWRNAQFHLIHVQRVRVVPGVKGFEDPDTGDQVLSCSSCHESRYTGVNINRTSPRRTCERCHNAQFFEGPSAATRFEAPSCTSCHVQHIKDTHWASSLRIAEVKMPAGPETVK